jgi:hypothetical protein
MTALSIVPLTAGSLDTQAERQVAEIRVRAERRCGELLKESKDNGTRQKAGDNRKTSNAATSQVTLADLGISRDQSSQWQKLAEIS